MNVSSSTIDRMSEEKRLVWDLPLRLFHWLFAIGIVSAWITAELEEMDLHFWIGYGMIALLVFRVIWGFIGPRHARFSSFIAKPSAMWQYARGLFGGSPVHTPGHNPLGGVMVLVMLILVALQAGTGLFTTDDVIYAGPYNHTVSGQTADKLTSLHHANFNWILAAIALHILAIAFYGVVKKQNLVVPMITGTKPAALVPESAAIASSQLLKALIVLAVSCAAVYWLIQSAPPPPDFYF
jgi:cytochrome b